MSQSDSYSLFTPLTQTRQNCLVLSVWAVWTSYWSVWYLHSVCYSERWLAGAAAAAWQWEWVSSSGVGEAVIWSTWLTKCVKLQSTEGRLTSCADLWLTVSGAWVCCPEPDWSHTECAARSLTRFGLADDSREIGWLIGALLCTMQNDTKAQVNTETIFIGSDWWHECKLAKTDSLRSGWSVRESRMAHSI